MSDKGKKQPRGEKAAPQAGSGRGQAPDSAKKVKADGKRAQATTDTGYVEVRDPNYVPRFKKRYNEVVKPELMKEFGYKNALQVPKIQKIVLNIGAGEGASDSKKVQQALTDLTAIAGQKPVVTKAKKSIASFKIAAGRAIGVKVTLRKDRMYEFLDRLVTMALPRVRDFRGLNGKSFDGRGNFAMGLKEHIVFVEIDYDKTETVWGMDIIINTSAKTDAEAMALLKGFQFPFMS